MNLRLLVRETAQLTAASTLPVFEKEVERLLKTRGTRLINEEVVKEVALYFFTHNMRSFTAQSCVTLHNFARWQHVR